MPTQSNTQAGAIPMVAAADFTGLEGRLVKLGSTGLVAVAAIADRTPYLVVEVLSTTKVVALPFSAERNIRVRAKGTGSRGAVLVNADPTTAADAGKLRAQPAANGTYHTQAIAEEDFVDGQLVLVRKIDREAVVINN
jgi:hypothetical protein